MKKLHSIKVKVLHLKVITVICCLILLAVVLFVGNKVYRLKNIVEITREMSIQLEVIHSQGNSFLLEIPANNEFYITGQDSALRELNREIKDFQKKLEIITENSGSGEALQVLQKMDSATAVYSSVFNDLVISLKELGNESNGVIGEWLHLTDEISDSARIKDVSAYSDMQEISRLELNYLISYAPEKFDAIKSKIETIKTTENPEIKNLTSKLDDLVKKGDYLRTLHTRIGSRNIQNTLKGDLFHSYNILKSTSESILPLINKFILKKQYLLFLILAVFFISFFIFLFYSYNKLAHSIIKPIHAINSFLYELKRGIFPKNVIEINDNADLAEVAKSLNYINEDLKTKTSFIKELVNGNYTESYDMLSNEDKLGLQLREVQKEIKEINDEQQRYNDENDIRRYINEGLAKFSELLRIHGDNLGKLTDEFIKNLVKYLGAIQGGIFIVDEKDNNLLRLNSSFAYDRKKYNSKDVQIGEGLVGTCAQEKKSIHINEIPSDYITVTSGLGDAPPDNLLLVPMLQDDQLLGVIEIASLNEFKDFEIDFSQQVSNNLASEITSARTNARTSELLEQSQRQAAEMAEQEEEMRQNMEELQATQEESTRRESELTGIVTTIDNTLYVAEYDMEGNIIRVNNRLLHLLHMDGRQLFGKPFSAIQGDQKKAFLTKKMIEQAIDGTLVESTKEISIGDKKYNFRHILSLVASKEGLPIKILHMILDIT
jgi:GAF domain-containing protein